MGPTMEDVARLAGVSAKTVSNVINSHPNVRTSTRDRVERAISQLDYQLNVAARSLRSGRSGVIGLAVPALSVAYFAELAEHVIAAAEVQGMAVLVERTGSLSRERAFLRSPRLQHIDGLILNPMDRGSADVAANDLAVPMVLLGDQFLGSPADHISTDQIAAAATATSHLIASGRRHIAVIGTHDRPEDGSARMRLDGYRQALTASGFTVNPRLIIPADPWDRANGARATRELLARHEPFDAIFAFNDTLAFGAMRVLQEAGLSIPVDVAVVGFDNLDESAYTVPSLTTIDPGATEIADSAVRLLMEQIHGRTSPAQVISAHRLVVRESSS